MKQFLTLSINLVKEAGEKIKKIFGHSIIKRLKEDDDLTTDADFLVEEFIFDFIKNHFPAHGFDSEERKIYQPDAEYMWILDPIDGTKYFHQGIPLFSIALALQHKKELVLGIVNIPETNQLFYTSTHDNMASILNDSKIYCSDNKPLEDISIILELPNRNNSNFNIDYSFSVMQALLRKVKRIRIIGVGSISLCYCAMGGFDVYMNLNMIRKHYDYAAGRIIVEQAGGQYFETNQMIIGGRKENVNNILDFLRQKNLLI